MLEARRQLNRPARHLVAVLTERDVVVADVAVQPDGSYEVWAQGERVNVGVPGEDVRAWADAAGDRVVARLGNRVLRTD